MKKSGVLGKKWEPRIGQTTTYICGSELEQMAKAFGAEKKKEKKRERGLKNKFVSLKGGDAEERSRKKKGRLFE